MLQTRSGKRTTQAALKIAVDMAEEGLISREEAVLRIDPTQLDQLLHPTLDPDADRDRARQGPAGLARRRLRRDRLRRRRGGAAEGARPHGDPRPRRDQPGGHPRHARRRRHPHHARRHDQPRGRGRARHGPALRGRRRGGHIDLERETLAGRAACILHKGDVITIDGSTGQIINGRVPMRQPELSADFATLMGWADGVRRMRRARQRRHAGRRRARRAPSAPRASASAAPSTCSSRRAASSPCAR